MSTPKSIGRKQIGGHGVIQHEWDARIMGDFRDAGEVRHVELGVSDRFGVDGFGLLSDRLLEGLEVV